MANYTWEPIEPLSDDRVIDLASMRSLYDSWRIFKGRLQNSSESSFREFNQRLVCRLRVETGIL